jgi:hypothetical protein
MDALSDVLKVAHLTGGVFLHAEFFAPWCIATRLAPQHCAPFLATASDLIIFHYVVEGELHIQVEGEEESLVIEAGEGCGATRAIASAKSCSRRRPIDGDSHRWRRSDGRSSNGADVPQGALVRPNHVVLTTTDSNTWGGASGHTYNFTRRPNGTTDIDVIVVPDGKNPWISDDGRHWHPARKESNRVSASASAPQKRLSRYREHLVIDSVLRNSLTATAADLTRLSPQTDEVYRQR